MTRNRRQPSKATNAQSEHPLRTPCDPLRTPRSFYFLSPSHRTICVANCVANRFSTDCSADILLIHLHHHSIITAITSLIMYTYQINNSVIISLGYGDIIHCTVLYSQYLEGCFCWPRSFLPQILFVSIPCRTVWCHRTGTYFMMRYRYETFAATVRTSTNFTCTRICFVYRYWYPLVIYSLFSWEAISS